MPPEPHHTPEPPAVKTPLWSIRLPRDGNAAVAVTVALTLFGVFWVAVKETAEHPWLTLALALPVHVSFYRLISTYRSARHGTRRKKRNPVQQQLRSDDRSARIGASRR